MLDFKSFKCFKFLVLSMFNPLSTNLTSWSNILKELSAKAVKLFECVKPFSEVGPERVKQETNCPDKVRPSYWLLGMPRICPRFYFLQYLCLCNQY